MTPPPVNLTRVYVVLGCLFLALLALPILVGMGSVLYEQYTGRVLVETPSFADARARAFDFLRARLHGDTTIAYPKTGPSVTETAPGIFRVEGQVVQFREQAFHPCPYLIELQYVGPKCADTTNWRLIQYTVTGVKAVAESRQTK